MKPEAFNGDMSTEKYNGITAVREIDVLLSSFPKDFVGFSFNPGLLVRNSDDSGARRSATARQTPCLNDVDSYQKYE
jgi:hypothetical protein